LARTAGLLKRPARAGKALPRLLAFSDPVRTPDVLAFAEDLPPGAGLVYRAFGSRDAETTAYALADIAFENGLILLIGQDAALAARIGAHGVHLPERLSATAARLKAAQPSWIVTTAAHSLAAARRAANAGADAALVSAVFPSNSPSASAPMGPVRLAGLVRQAGLPIYALGGVNDGTAARLLTTGVVGLAGIEGFFSAHPDESRDPG
jgi:thiamine-phosphate pyrophosphorylase